MLGKFSSRLAVTGTAIALLWAVSAGPAWAAKPSGGSRTPTAGIDVSYRRAGDSLPTNEAFAAIGINGGVANTYSPCLADQWRYASGLSGTVGQAPAQTYLNTGDAGNSVADWPSPRQVGGYGKAHPTAVTSDSTGPVFFDTPSGNCTFAAGSTSVGDNSAGCAYIYGYDMVAGLDYTDADGNPQTVEGDASAFAGARPAASCTASRSARRRDRQQLAARDPRGPGDERRGPPGHGRRAQRDGGAGRGEPGPGRHLLDRRPVAADHRPHERVSRGKPRRSARVDRRSEQPEGSGRQLLPAGVHRPVGDRVDHAVVRRLLRRGPLLRRLIPGRLIPGRPSPEGRRPAPAYPASVPPLAGAVWPEIAAAPLVVVALGSVEQHGHHLPLGTDTAVASTSPKP